MVLDKNTTLSSDQAITASAASTDVLDLGARGKTAYNSVQLKHNVGKARHIPFLIQVTENFATLTSLTVAIETDDNSAFSSPKEIIRVVVPVAELKAGFIFPIDKLPRGIVERYVRVYYTVTGSNATAGKITAGVVLAVDGAYVG